MKLTGLYNAAYLSSLGLQVKTVVDVGVRSGTPELYEAFPDSQFILVDPQPRGENQVKVKPKSYSFHNVALGSTRGELQLSVEGAKSSLMPRTKMTKGESSETVAVQVVTFDDLLDEVAYEAPVGVKIDTEGFELEVLSGLRKHLSSVAFFLCEVSIRKRFIGGYRFSDMIVYMREHGFELYHQLNVPRPRNRIYDCLFLPKDHPLFGADE